MYVFPPKKKTLFFLDYLANIALQHPARSHVLMSRHVHRLDRAGLYLNGVWELPGCTLGHSKLSLMSELGWKTSGCAEG